LGDDDVIVAGQRQSSGLWRVPASGGTPERLTTVTAADDDNDHRWPQVLPRGDDSPDNRGRGATESSLSDLGGGFGPRHSLAQYERLGSELSRPHFLALLAEVLGTAGRIDEGLAVIEDALASVERTDERYYLPELQRLLGELSRRSSDSARRAGSTEWFTRAVLDAQRQRARSWELRASVSLARSPMPHVTIEEARSRVAAVSFLHRGIRPERSS
jgi:hypothetical protein